jgi:hypothetical protein
VSVLLFVGMCFLPRITKLLLITVSRSRLIDSTISRFSFVLFSYVSMFPHSVYSVLLMYYCIHVVHFYVCVYTATGITPIAVGNKKNVKLSP